MKSVRAFLMFALSAAAFFAVAAVAPVYAQESQDGAEDGARPQMPRLFFTNEQRRILEVVRQEFITEDNLEFAEFAPLLIEQQETIESEDQFRRSRSLRVDAIIRNRGTGGGALWINHERYSLEDISGALERDGLGGMMFESGGAISGTDSINNSRFVLKVGQNLADDGEVNETYPVVVIKKQ